MKGPRSKHYGTVYRLFENARDAAEAALLGHVCLLPHFLTQRLTFSILTPRAKALAVEENLGSAAETRMQGTALPSDMPTAITLPSDTQSAASICCIGQLLFALLDQVHARTVEALYSERRIDTAGLVLPVSVGALAATLDVGKALVRTAASPAPIDVDAVCPFKRATSPRVVFRHLHVLTLATRLALKGWRHEGCVREYRWQSYRGQVIRALSPAFQIVSFNVGPLHQAWVRRRHSLRCCTAETGVEVLVRNFCRATPHSLLRPTEGRFAS